MNDIPEWDFKKLLVPTCMLQGFQSRETPCSRRQIVKLHTLFKTQDPENHTLLSGTYLFRPNKAVPPPPQGVQSIFNPPLFKINAFWRRLTDYSMHSLFREKWSIQGNFSGYLFCSCLFITVMFFIHLMTGFQKNRLLWKEKVAILLIYLWFDSVKVMCGVKQRDIPGDFESKMPLQVSCL